MFQNYFKIAWRNLMKNKVYSFINIFGLAVGFACCMLIGFYLHHETSYDKHHKNSARLYQLGTIFSRKDGEPSRTPNTPAGIAAAMKQEFPEIASTARIMALFAEDKTLIQYRPAGMQPRSFYETKGFMADPSFFELFTYKFIEGSPATALSGPNTIVLNEEIARKLFGREPAMNKVIHVSSNSNGDYDFTVTGVFRSQPGPSHIDGRFFMSFMGGNMEQMINNQTDMAGNNMFQTYLLLHKSADAKALEAKFPAFVDKYIGKDLKAMGFYKTQFLIPVKDIHLRAGMPNDVTPVGSVTYLYVLGSIALFTLLIACINFMNLATARSSKRSSEVGVRKVLGAERKMLVMQFLGESILMSLIAYFIAIGLVRILTPVFASVSGKTLAFSWSAQWQIVTAFFIIAVLTGIAAGLYPAFYLSSFQPVRVLKGRFSNSLSAVALRKGLVIFQFIISVILIIASVVISNQMTFLRSTDLGFAKDQQVIIPLRSATAKSVFTSLKNEIKNNRLVLEAGGTYYYPGTVNPSDMGLYKQGKTVNDAKRVQMDYIDETFLQTLEIKPVAGRLFSADFPGDTSDALILNEEAIKQIGFSSPQEAINNTVYFDFRGTKYTFRIVGVVKNFHFEDLHVPINPYGFGLSKPPYSYLVAHANTRDLGPLLKSFEASWRKLNPSEPFEYNFLDQDFQKQYEAENRLAAIVGYFTIIAILISCLGLFGLATFSAEQRTKEIGIRKVLGASVSSIIALLSKDFLKLVAISVIIASPIAWWAMNKWLQDFAYRITIGWWVFLISAIMALVIAFLTISSQALRAANTNPVRNLRTE